MKMEWTKDEDGDFELQVDGEHFGIVCPHHLPSYALCVWDFGECQAMEDTVEKAKRHLEKAAKKQAFLDEQADQYDLANQEDET